MKSKVSTVAEYLKSLPDDRRKIISAVRKVILRNLPKGYEENMNWGVISYEIPLARFPETYNGQPLMYAGLGAQKNYNAVYLMGAYGDGKLAKRLKDAFAQAGKKLDMGKCCIRFKKVEDIPLEVIGEVVAAVEVEEYLEFYERTRASTATARRQTPKAKAKGKTGKK